MRLKNAMYRKARKLQAAIEKEDQIMHKYEDGSYWYDTQSDACDLEATEWATVDGHNQAAALFASLERPKRRTPTLLLHLSMMKMIFIHQIKACGRRPEDGQQGTTRGDRNAPVG